MPHVFVLKLRCYEREVRGQELQQSFKCLASLKNKKHTRHTFVNDRITWHLNKPSNWSNDTLIGSIWCFHKVPIRASFYLVWPSVTVTILRSTCFIGNGGNYFVKMLRINQFKVFHASISSY